MVIVTVRAAAKITHLETLLVKINLVYFVAVCVISFLFGFAVAALWWRFAVKQKHLAETERAYIELDLASLAYNAAILQAAMPQGSELMVVVKANATLVDNRKDSRISAPRIAEQAGSISNELLSRMGNRLPIVIKE